MKGKIFNSQEVQAIIAGTKTMFRKLIKNKTNFGDFLQTREAGDKWYRDRVISMRGKRGLWADYTLENFVEKFCPYQVGQKIFVKESFDGYADSKLLNKYNILYRADGKLSKGSSWKPAQQMKQEHSRITLQIKEIRVERLAEISEGDLKLEGFKTDYKIMNDGIYKKDSIKFFQEDWNATHKKPEEKFEANPWVWSIQFEVVK